MALHTSAHRYLVVTGNLPRWHYAAFVLFAGWLIYLRSIGSKPSFAHYFFLFLIPIAAGTGLLTSARSGQLDLLFGSGQDRAGVWRTALIHAWTIPLLMGMLTFSIGGGNWKILLVRLPAVLCFTGGVAFAAGLVELRYVTGIVWLLVRVLFVMTPAGLTASMQLSKGPALPEPFTLMVLLIAAPESALEARLPVGYALGLAFAGILALIVSYVVFQRADFGGKRS